MKKYKDITDDGFTIIEVLVVTVVIAVLTTISFISLGGMRKDAVTATLQSDVRNAGAGLAGIIIQSKDPSIVPNNVAFFVSDPENHLVVKSIESEAGSFCIIGSNTRYEDMAIYYSSNRGGITKNSEDCGMLGMTNTPPLIFVPSTPDETLVAINPTVDPTVEPSIEPTTDPTVEPSQSPTITPTPIQTQTPTVEPTIGTNPTPTSAIVVKQPMAPAGYSSSKRKKYNICHNGNTLSLPLSSIQNGHNGHDDDIIPPIPSGYPTGKNWDEQGARTWYNNCIEKY